MAKILIVEDYPSLQEIYQAAFEKAGYTVHSAGDGEEAINKCAKTDYDAVLLDMLLPNLDGLAFLEKVQPNSSNFRPAVIVLSDFDKPELVEQAKALGVKEYLVKAHYSPKEVVEKLRTILGGNSKDESDHNS